MEINKKMCIDLCNFVGEKFYSNYTEATKSFGKHKFFS